MDIKDEIREKLIGGDIEGVKEAVGKARDGGIPAPEILLEALVPGIQEVGRLFEAGEAFLPEMMISAEAMKQGVAEIQSLLESTDIQSNGKVLIATVAGDVHDIGKNLVALMIKSAGFDLEDMGVDVPTEKIVASVKASAPDVLALSALLTTTMQEIPVVFEALESAGLRDKIKTLVGGAPISKQFAEESGADGYAPDALQAAKAVQSLIDG
ncbi:MAG: corrinoid protein [Deltaproteobacteria bacterium]|jgi:5-methyltetrahydrofolate--homocysteine methyltransferase|nr:corrinoid protein [Deltaproteobacteria bacterium]